MLFETITCFSHKLCFSLMPCSGLLSQPPVHRGRLVLSFKMNQDTRPIRSLLQALLNYSGFSHPPCQGPLHLSAHNCMLHPCYMHPSSLKPSNRPFQGQGQAILFAPMAQAPGLMPQIVSAAWQLTDMLLHVRECVWVHICVWLDMNMDMSKMGVQPGTGMAVPVVCG